MGLTQEIETPVGYTDEELSGIFKFLKYCESQELYLARLFQQEQYMGEDEDGNAVYQPYPKGTTKGDSVTTILIRVNETNVVDGFVSDKELYYPCQPGRPGPMRKVVNNSTKH